MNKIILFQNSSDKKFNEQVRRSLECNELLIKALYKLSSFDGITNSDSEEIKQLWEKCRNYNFKLMLCMKINHEIQHNQILLNALISQNRTCNTVRKRLKWLEERFARLLSNDFKLDSRINTENDPLSYLRIEVLPRDKLNDEKIHFPINEVQFLDSDNTYESLSNDAYILSDKISAEKGIIHDYEEDTKFFADEYLLSKHHRYKYNESAILILNNNPSSYHFLALPEADSCTQSMNNSRITENNDDIHKNSMEDLLMDIEKLCVLVHEKMNESDFINPLNVDILMKKDMSKINITLPKSVANLTWTLPKPSILPLTRIDLNKYLPPIYTSSINDKDWKPRKIVSQSQLLQLMSERSYSRNSSRQLTSERFLEKRGKNLSNNPIYENFKTSGIKFNRNMDTGDYFNGEDLKVERIKYLIKNKLYSPDSNSRISGLKILSVLRPHRDFVNEELMKILKHDKNINVQIECVHTLILNGEFNKLIIRRFVSIISKSNTSCQLYLLNAIMESNNLPIYEQNDIDFKNLMESLENLFLLENDSISFATAIVMGRIQFASPVAISYLSNYLDRNKDFNSKIKDSDIYLILNTLVKGFMIVNEIVINSMIILLSKSTSWIIRMNTIHLISYIGSLKMQDSLKLDDIVACLQNILWNDSSIDIREEAGLCLSYLDKFCETYQDILKKLYSSDENMQIQALKSIESLKCCDELVQKKMNEMLEFETSDRVKFQIIKTLNAIKKKSRSWSRSNFKESA